MRDPDPDHRLVGKVEIGGMNDLVPGKLGRGIDPDRLEPMDQLRDPDSDRVQMSK